MKYYRYYDPSYDQVALVDGTTFIEVVFRHRNGQHGVIKQDKLPEGPTDEVIIRSHYNEISREEYAEFRLKELWGVK